MKFSQIDGALTGRGAPFDLEKRTVLNPNAADPVVKTLIGSKLANVPAHAGSLFVLKQLGPWGIRGGVTTVGSRAGDPFGTSCRLPSYTVTRANLSYAVTPDIKIRANLDNVFDSSYISSSDATVGTTPGAPRNFRVTLTKRFP